MSLSLCPELKVSQISGRAPLIGGRAAAAAAFVLGPDGAKQSDHELSSGKLDKPVTEIRKQPYRRKAGQHAKRIGGLIVAEMPRRTLGERYEQRMDKIDRVGNKPEVVDKPVAEQELGHAPVTRQNRDEWNEQEIDRQIIDSQDSNGKHRGEEGDDDNVLNHGRKPVETGRVS